MPEASTPERNELSARAAHLVPSIVLAAAAIGFFTGTGQLRAPVGEAPTKAPPPSAPARVHEAVTYAQLPSVDLGPNAGWRAPLASQDAVDVLEPVPTQSPAKRAAALNARAGRRAYMGAPPVIPHQVDSRSADSCLACHEHGLRLGEVVAPAIPHDAYANCLQCHAAPTPPALGGLAEPEFHSSFAGLPEARAGDRFGPGSPPVIPHPTAMRERCVSCHVQSASGLKVAHPWRVNCTQCHASSTGFAR